jgi:tRNA C32,U32 (ribose-2'-O)-methylase TrmJ
MLRAAVPSAAGPAAFRPRARAPRRRASSRPSDRRGARVEASGDPSPSARRSAAATSPGDDAPRHNRRGDNASRDRFADTLRETHSGGRITKRDFQSHLGKLRDPPAALRDVTVVLVGTKKAGNVGAVARACGSFECEDLRLVAPRCDPDTRASLSAAKGAQHIVHGAGVYDTLEDALLDVDTAVAFHVWCEGLEPVRARDVDALVRAFPGGGAKTKRKDAFLFYDDDDDDDDDDASFEATATEERHFRSETYLERDPETHDPVVPVREGSRRGRIRPSSSSRENPPNAPESKSNVQVQAPSAEEHGWRRRTHVTPPRLRLGRGSGKLALVFGREVEGLTDGEVNACDAMCAIPTGRLIESLSVSHAAVIILSQYYQSRQNDAASDVNARPST